MTATCASGSRSNRLSASARWRTSSSLKALSRSGRFRLSVAIWVVAGIFNEAHPRPSRYLSSHTSLPSTGIRRRSVCSSARNYMGYCDKEFDRMVDQQSMEADPAKRKKLVWDIDHKLQEDLARPVIYHLGWCARSLAIARSISLICDLWRFAFSQ